MWKTLLLLFLITDFIPVFLFAQQTPKFITGKGIGYLEHLPPDYQTTSKNYPVIIYLHGAGESGDGSPQDLQRVKKFGPPYHIEHGHNMCFTANGKTECYIVIAPQVFESDDWRGKVATVIDHILNGPDNYRVDTKRIYLTGMSLGGHGVYTYAACSLNNPNTLAAIIPTAAWTDYYTEGCTIAARKMAVWAFHGGSDITISIDRGQSAFQSIKDCTDPVPTADLLFTIYPNNRHNVWTEAFDPSHTFENPNVYEWLLSHTLNGEPPDSLDPVDPDPVTSIPETINNSGRTFTIHPNPVYNDLHLSFNEQKSSEAIVNILSVTGDVVMSVNATSESIDISSLHAGVYIVQVRTNKGTIDTERLVKLN